MKELVNEITSVPLKVSNEVIQKFVRKCKEKHAIAFLQWRFLYSKSHSNMYDLKQIINDRIWHVENNFIKRLDFKLSEETNKNNEVRKYDDYVIHEEKKMWNINSFQSIGWPDPFP